MHTEISAGQWRELIHSALAFAEATPWKWMDDGQVIGIVHPQTQEKGYCSIMGRESEFKALALYPGRLGWWSYLQITQDDLETDPNEVLYKQRCIVLSFEAQATADTDDIALLRHAGLQPAQLEWIPSFRSYLPGFVPSAPSVEEAHWLSLALPQVLAAAMEVYAGLYAIPENGLDKQGRLLCRSLDVEAGGWHTDWLKPDPNADFSPPRIQLDAEQTAAGRALPSTEDIWLIEEFFLPEPAEDPEGDRAFFPRVLVCFDMQEQSFRGLSLLHPDNWPVSLGETLLEMLTNQGHRPGQVVVSKRANFILAKPFCQALGIGINLEQGLDILPDLREAVLEMWREQQ
jgi:hypothetical protein